MSMKTSIPLTDGEWNVIIGALYHKRYDSNNSKLAKQQYTDLYVKLMNIKYGEGSAVI
jgi:hypothetical protein